MADEDWIDALLDNTRPAPLADDGFTHRLLAQLPARRRRTPQWLVPTAAVLGMVLAAFISRPSGNVVYAAQSLFADHRMSVLAFLPAMLVLAGCAWALSESR
jgi:hypothetical protein